MSIAARVFVAVIFGILGAAFITTTAVLYNEFQDANWFSLAVFYSHLFIFFPTFGIIALIAFYLPSVVLVDMYWRHVRFGVLRFTIGMIILVVASYFIATELLKGDVATLWGPKPEILKADKGEPAGCNSAQQTCLRVPVLEALVTVRQESQRRVGLSQFARTCTPDPLMGTPPYLLEKRYCFVTKSFTNAAECCNAQKRFANALKEFYAPVENRSLTEKVHAQLLPLNVFFLLVLLVIGILLARWRRKVDEHYTKYVTSVERGLIIGAVVMLVWPVTNHGFLQSNNVLYGSFSDGIYESLTPVFSLVFAAWALMLLFFFFRRFEKDLEAVGKMAGIIGSAIAILKYEEIIDYSVRFAGSGANQVTLGILFVIGFFAIVPVLFVKKRLDQAKMQPSVRPKDEVATAQNAE